MIFDDIYESGFLLTLWSLDLNEHFCFGELERYTPLMQFSVDFAWVNSMTDIRKDVKQRRPLGLIPVPHLPQPLPFIYKSVSSGNAVALISPLFFYRGIKFKNHPVSMYTTMCVVSSYLEANNSHVGLFIALNLPPSLPHSPLLALDSF